MPYDPRSITVGGNRSLDITFSRKAPPGKYRVVGVDTFDGGDWHENDFDDLETAIKHADTQTKGKSMLKMHVYDDTGANVHSAGRF